MVTDRFGQRVKSRQFACSMAAALCLLVGFFAGCARKDGITVKVVEAKVSDTGVIFLKIRIKKNNDAYEVSSLQKTGTTETLFGDVLQDMDVGTFVSGFETVEPSSVQFLVKQGESVFVPVGTEKDLLQFIPRDEQKGMTARYTIRVHEDTGKPSGTVPKDR